MMLTAREVPAADALAIGLLDRVTEPGGALKQALELAGQFGAMSRPALAAVLRCVDDAAELPLAEGMAREADRVTDLLDSPDGQRRARRLRRQAPGELRMRATRGMTDERSRQLTGDLLKAGAPG